MGPKKKVTFDDIAKYTHFSKTTISRYFNHPDSLTLENQKIISDALEKLKLSGKQSSPDPGQRQDGVYRASDPGSLSPLLRGGPESDLTYL